MQHTHRPTKPAGASLGQAIEASLQQLTKEALQDELKRLVRERKDELAERPPTLPNSGQRRGHEAVAGLTTTTALV